MTIMAEERITLEQVRRRVADMTTAFADPDGPQGPQLHVQEDILYDDVLRAIAEGAPDAQEMAREALKTSALDFDRWYE